MKYKEIARSLISEERTDYIKKRKFLKIYKENIGIHPKNLPKIYRGKEGEPTFGYVQPSKSKRKSAYTQNYYTMIIDNSDNWKAYPKRSESIICTTSIGKAESFGNVYRVFPILGSKIGACPESDIWDSFSYLEKQTGVWDLENFNSVLKKLSLICLNSSLSEKDWKTFIRELDRISTCDSFQYLYNNDGYPPEIDKVAVPFKTKMKKIAKYFQSHNKSLSKLILEFFNPKKNHFSLKEFFPNTNFKGNIEVWTDSPSLLVPIEKLKQLNFNKI